MDTLEKITTACAWFLGRNSSSKDAVKVTTTVKWADWKEKNFSPVMAVLWYSEVHKSNDGYDTFLIPPPETWIEKVASYLEVSESWVTKFADQCYSNSLEKYTISISFTGYSHDGSMLKNPKVSFERTQIPPEDVLPEALRCIELYGPRDEQRKIPYWTKNPPVKLYEGKLTAAAYDLFSAMNALEK